MLEFCIDQNGFIVYRPTSRDIDLARDSVNKLFSEDYRLNKKTVYNGETVKLGGALAEVVFARVFPNATKSTDLAYDFVLNDQHIDVKCKTRNVQPKDTFDASFFYYQCDFKTVDKYVFMSTIPNFERYWICGYILKDELLSHPEAKLWKKGQIDPSNGKLFKEDCWNIAYKHLHHYKLVS